MRLVGKGDPGWNGRAHFFGAAARAMRNILVDRARRFHRVRHGSGQRPIALGPDATEVSFDAPPESILALHDALERLEREDPRRARVVELRFFGGLAEEAIAPLLGVTTRTVERDWRFARAWLHREMDRAAGGE